MLSLKSNLQAHYHFKPDFQKVGQHTKGKWLTHWGRVTRICVSKLTIIGSDNGLRPDRHQAIIWNNTNFSEISIKIH